MDTDRPEDEAYEPVEVESGMVESVEADLSEEPVAAPKGRLPLGALAGVGATLAGVVVWSLLYQSTERDYVGISVVFALLIGYVVREVSRRSDVVPRVISAVLAAILCYLGTITAAAAYTAQESKLPFGEVWQELFEHQSVVFKDRNALTWVIYAAAIVVAYMSAGPPRPKQTAKAGSRPAEPAVPAEDELPET